MKKKKREKIVEIIRVPVHWPWTRGTLLPTRCSKHCSYQVGKKKMDSLITPLSTFCNND